MYQRIVVMDTHKWTNTSQPTTPLTVTAEVKGCMTNGKILSCRWSTLFLTNITVCLETCESQHDDSLEHTQTNIFFSNISTLDDIYEHCTSNLCLHHDHYLAMQKKTSATKSVNKQQTKTKQREADEAKDSNMAEEKDKSGQDSTMKIME